MCQFKEGLIIGEDGERKTEALLRSIGYSVQRAKIDMKEEGGPEVEIEDCDLYLRSDNKELMRIGGYYRNGKLITHPMLMVECKRDLRADETGNLAFEILSSARNFAPGSLLKTQAHLLSHVTDSKVYIINRAQFLSWIISNLMEKKPDDWRLVQAHDNAQMRALLIPIEDLLGTKVDVQVFPVIENGDGFDDYLKAYGCKSGKCNL